MNAAPVLLLVSCHENCMYSVHVRNTFRSGMQPARDKSLTLKSREALIEAGDWH
jgi:hypothetical protein